MNDICNTYTKSGLLITDCCIFIKCIVMAVRLNDLLATYPVVSTFARLFAVVFKAFWLVRSPEEPIYKLPIPFAMVLFLLPTVSCQKRCFLTNLRYCMQICYNLPFPVPVAGS